METAPVQSTAGSGRPNSRDAAYLLVCAALFGALVWLSSNPRQVLAGENDFLQFYSSATLAGTPDLYSLEASRRIQTGITSSQYDAIQRNIRLPFYPLLLKPLALLPFRAAYALFQLTNLAALGVFLWYFAGRSRDLLLLAAVSMPVVANVTNGQDSILVASLAALAVVLARKERDFASGLVFSLCAIKVHLFLLVPVAVLVHRRWRILNGGITGGMILFALSCIPNGLSWTVELWKLATDPVANPRPEMMPTVHGLAVSCGWSRGTEWGLMLPVVLIAGAAIWRARSFDAAVAAALIGGLLAGYHAYVQDAVLLLVALALLAGHRVRRIIRVVLILALLPPVYYLMVEGPPWSAAVHILCGTVLVFLAIWPPASEPVRGTR